MCRGAVIGGAVIFHHNHFAWLRRTFSHRHKGAGAHFFQFFFIQNGYVQRLVGSQLLGFAGQIRGGADIRRQITQVFGVADALGNGLTFGQRRRLITAQPDQSVGLARFFSVVFLTFGFGVTVQRIAECHGSLLGPPDGRQSVTGQGFECQGNAAFDAAGGTGNGVENFYRIGSFQGVFAGADQQDALGPNAGDGG